MAPIVAGAFSLATPAPASAAEPLWQLQALANSTAAPGKTLDYMFELRNLGTSEAIGATEPIILTGSLPTGLSVVSVTGWECPSFSPGESTFTCATSETIPTSPAQNVLGKKFIVSAAVEPGAAEGLRSAHFEVSGGTAPLPAQTDAPATITQAPPTFGIAAFDTSLSADPVGTPYTQAAGHPYEYTTYIDFNSFNSPEPLKGELTPVEAIKDVEVQMPPGFLGDPSLVGECNVTELAKIEGLAAKPLCSPDSQVGTADVKTYGYQTFQGPLPVFQMVSPPDVPARFGFNVLGTIVIVDIAVRSSGDYGLTALVPNTSEGIGIAGSRFTIWGEPANEAHRPERSCAGQSNPSNNGPTCAGAGVPFAYLRQPTSCTKAGEGLPVSLRIDSWQNRGHYVQREITTHQPAGYPLPEVEEGLRRWGAPQGPTGCANVPFNPGISAQPTTDQADSPSGLDLHLSVPQNCWQPEQQGSICQSDLRDAEVSLPVGMTLNPSAAAGLTACSPAQVGLATPVGQASPIHFDEAQVSCPESSKIGTATIDTPLLGDPLQGSVYLAQQSQNPFDSLLAMYLVAEGSGVVVKQAGEIVSDPNTGRLTTVFKEAPQQPFSDLHVELFGGPRAPLRTPPSCGTFAIAAELTPWSGNAPANVGSPFEIEKCPNSGFNPKLAAGTQNPLAGKYSPFSLRLSREDGTQEIGSLSATLPEGLIGKPAGIPYCSDATLAAISGELGTGAAQEARPACPAQSRIGTLTVGAGAGPNPFYTQSGKAYLAGPYKGAPLSLAVVAPAVAGPFDLGSVVVRNALRIDPQSTQVSAVSDPLPSILHGIPLDLRDIRVNLNRDEFTLNPTSCEPLSIASTITSTQGATANPLAHFQVAGCDRLGFKPKLGLKLKGDTKRSGHPALTAVLRARKGDANIGRVQVALPHSEFLAQNHIKTICTRVQFAAGGGGGEACPKGSVYGKVTATSPLVDYPLAGNVYLRSSSHSLPDLVLALHGPPSQPIQVEAVGRIDSIDGGIRTTFAAVPDAPLTKVVLKMPGGKKGLIENSTNICRSTNNATVQMDAHNGTLRDFAAPLKAKCSAKPGRRHKHR